MSEQITPLPQQPTPDVVGMITPDTAEKLAATSLYDGEALNYSSEPAKIMRSIGASIMTRESDGPQYALVVGEDHENSGPKPLHYVAVDAKDLGTRIQPKNNEQLGLPEPDIKYGELVEKAFADEAARTPDKKESEEKKQESSYPKIEFTPDELRATADMLQGLQTASVHGRTESMLHSALSSLSPHYSNQPKELEKMMLAWGSIAAGAGRSRNFMDAVVSALHQNKALKPEDKTAFFGMLDNVYTTKKASGASPEESVFATSRMLRNNIAGLAEAESRGQDIDNLRLVTAGMIVGATAGTPGFNTDASAFMDLLQKRHAQPQK